MNASPILKQEKIDDLTRRIVQAAHPRRIVLFGSAARGRMSPHSDLDVLVVMPGTESTAAGQQEPFTESSPGSAIPRTLLWLRKTMFDVLATSHRW